MTKLPPPGQRIIILGNAGSGKTTLARQLAQRLDLTHTEVDSLYWDPGWTPAPKEVFRERVSQAVQTDRWVLDGNYSTARDILWPRADTAIWLDYPLPVTFWRLFWRTMRRTLGGEELWNGNRERLADQLFSRDSLFLYVLKTYRRRRREFPALFQQPAYQHLTVVHLRTPRETEEWLQSIGG